MIIDVSDVAVHAALASSATVVTRTIFRPVSGRIGAGGTVPWGANSHAETEDNVARKRRGKSITEENRILLLGLSRLCILLLACWRIAKVYEHCFMRLSKIVYGLYIKTYSDNLNGPNQTVLNCPTDVLYGMVPLPLPKLQTPTIIVGHAFGPNKAVALGVSDVDKVLGPHMTIIQFRWSSPNQVSRLQELALVSIPRGDTKILKGWHLRHIQCCAKVGERLCIVQNLKETNGGKKICVAHSVLRPLFRTRNQKTLLVSTVKYSYHVSRL